MTLLHAQTLQFLETHSVDRRPSYAILSHTWDVAELEVSYQDILSLRAKGHKGYGKIEGCYKQALADRIEYVWLDTCCIDKTSSSELSEAINSMFRWYAEARLCYAYLSDVADSSVFSRAVGPKGELREDIKKSRWFTRGWTLQELWDPRRLCFFSSLPTGNVLELAKNGETASQLSREYTQIHLWVSRSELLTIIVLHKECPGLQIES
jgi:hypothetical protein